jgi:hypothetical protein
LPLLSTRCMAWYSSYICQGHTTETNYEPRRDPNCEGGRRVHSKPAVALWHETSRSADAPGTIKAVLPCRLLHEDFQTVPESPGPQPLCTRCHVLPLATPGSPEREKCPFCPCFSTPSRDWGRPTSVLRAYTLFYTSRGALRHSPSWSFFRQFWAGKYHRQGKIGCVVVHHCHRVSPT